jgi:hypothetical protein
MLADHDQVRQTVASGDSPSGTARTLQGWREHFAGRRTPGNEGLVRDQWMARQVQQERYRRMAEPFRMSLVQQNSNHPKSDETKQSY